MSQSLKEIMLEQRIYVQRMSDAILGKNKMDYQQFCEEIDKLIPSESMNLNDKGILISTRETHKAVAGLIKDEIGKSYYEIYLSIKYNLPLA